jgi:hypothetical protein
MQHIRPSSSPQQITPQRLADSLAYVDHLAQSAELYKAERLQAILVSAKRDLQSLQLQQAQYDNIDHLCEFMGAIADAVLDVRDAINLLRISN